MSLEGAAINVDDNANTVYWGKPTTASQALKKGATSNKIKTLINELQKVIKEAK
jgi:lipid-binding SYLF domain-containing protein